jgi:hypothetical protein
MPVSSVAICVEGVLMKNTVSVPIPTGIALYHSLKENFNILLYSDQDRKKLDHWLSIEALNIQTAVEYNDEQRHWLSESDRKIAQLNSLRTRGYKIEIVIEPSPLASVAMLENGFNVLTFSHAQYAMPKWRPDFKGQKSEWAQLMEAAEKQAELKALDKRLEKLNEERDWD